MDHAFTLLRPPGGSTPVEIDNGMVPLVRALWALGFATIDCCENLGESLEDLPDRSPHMQHYVDGVQGRAMVTLLDADDAAGLLDLLTEQGPRYDAFHTRMHHWAVPDAWKWHVSFGDVTTEVVWHQDPDLTQDDVADTRRFPPAHRPFGVGLTLPVTDVPEVVRRLEAAATDRMAP